jgi:hypothetical protein
MRAFENLAIAFVGTPTNTEVLDRIRRDEPCGADPGSQHCAFVSAGDDYLLSDVAADKICRLCPVFDLKRQTLQADWEEWVLALQEVYT